METLKKIRARIDQGENLNSFIGQPVKIGFLVLKITGYRLTPKDSLPNVWLLEKGQQKYEFTPFNGLQKTN